MKLFTLVSFLFVTTIAFGQKKAETIKVWGNCGMCKKTIETAAVNAGATSADWNEETKQLQVSYKAKKTNGDKIQQAIAGAGYDTEKFTADQSVYDQLHGCCKYDRKEASASVAGDTAKEDCCKNGKCTKDHAKADHCKDCCKDGVCKKGSDCCKEGNCCKDGKCSKGGDCCKK